MLKIRVMRPAYIYLTLFISIIIFSIGNLSAQSNIWVGSWSCAPYAAGSGNTPPSPYLENNTLRQVVRVSIGGDSLRLKFSNKTCSTPVTMKSVYIAVSNGGSAVEASTNTQLKFEEETTVTIAAYSSVTSDPVKFPLTPSMRLAITIYYGDAESNTNITSHVASRTDSYIVTGNQTTEAEFGSATVTAHWFHINTIDVVAPDTAGCVGVLGNSITDGYGLSGGLQNRWTDFFSQKLLDDKRTENIGVLNLGIGGTNIAGSWETTGLSRYKDDLLGQSGIRWIIIYYGINDIAGGASASTITNAYQTIIDDAHAMGVKVYGATLTPCRGHSHYTEAREQVRSDVNKWIRATGNFDGCIDFDKAIRDPYDTTKLASEYSNDWLHPNAEGYEFLGNSVNINLFTDIESTETLFASAGSDQSLVDLGNSGSVSVNLNGSSSVSWGADIVSYVWAIGENQVATGELPTVNLPVGTHTITLTVTDGDGKTDSDEVVITVAKDSGVWLEAECGTVGSLWETISDNDASNNKYVTIKDGENSTGSAPTSTTGLITYTFDVEESGTYYLYARVLCPNANDDSFWIKMNNGSYSMWNNISTAEWQWVKFSYSFSLSKGSNKLTIGYREDGAQLDKLWITKTGGDVTGEGSAAANCGSSATGHKIIHDINVYPNPVSEGLTLELAGLPADVSIYNNIGREVFSKGASSTKMLVNMANFHPGIYFIKIIDKYKTSVEKVVKK